MLDIDETLSWTIGTWVEQLQQRFGNPENLSVKEMAEKYKYTQNVPYWQFPEALDWTEKARENNELQERFMPIEGASAGVEKLQTVVPVVGYLTTRPRSVLGGTRKWLEKNRFPEAEVLARPADVSSQEGDRWKAEVLDFLYPQAEGIVDDKLAVVEFLPKSYQGTILLYNSQETNVEGIKVLPCKTWPDVYARAKQVWGK